MRFISIILFSLSILTACSQPPEGGSSSQDVEGESFPPPTLSQITAENRSPLYLSKDGGSNWEPIAPEIPQDANASFLDTLDGEIVFATDDKGIFMSEDNWTHWKQIGDALPHTKINSLHIANGVIYVGVYQYGIYISENKGETWYNMNANLMDLRIQSICTFNDQLFIGTDSNISLWSAEKKKWETLMDAVQTVSLERWGDKLVAGTHLGTMLSDSQGRNWRFIHEKGSPHYTHIVQGSIVEMLIRGPLYISNDGGFSWYDSPYEPHAGTYVYEVIETPDSWILSNNYGIFRSKNGGISWQHVFQTEEMGFLDLMAIGDVVIGGTRKWDEFRKRN